MAFIFFKPNASGPLVQLISGETVSEQLNVTIAANPSERENRRNRMQLVYGAKLREFISLTMTHRDPTCVVDCYCFVK